MTDSQTPKNDDHNIDMDSVSDSHDDALFDDLNTTLNEGQDDIASTDNDSFDDLSASDEFLVDDDGYDFDDNIDDGESLHDSFDAQDMSDKTTINWFNIILIVGVVIIIAGAGYMLFLKPDNSTLNMSQQADSQPQQQAEANNAQATLDAGQDADKNLGFFHKPEILSDANQMANNDAESEKNTDDLFQAMPDDVAATSNENLDDLFASLPVRPQQQPVNETPSLPQAMDSVPSLPTDEGVNTAQQDMSEAQIVEQTPTLPVSDDIIPADDSMMDDYMVAIDDAITAPQEPVAEVATAEIAEDTAPQNDATEPKAPEKSIDVDAPSVALAELDTINQRIDALSQRMDTLLTVVEGLAKSSSPSVVSASSNTDQVDSLKKTISRLENKVESLSRTQKTAVKTPSTAVSRPKTVVVKKQPTIQWDFRGAMNGKAYIAEQGTQNIQTVSVGQTVKGLGTIQSIAMENGRWVIRATQQTITQ